MGLSISGHIAKARASKNPVHLVRAATLAVRQRRTAEIVHSLTTLVTARPSRIDPIPETELRTLMPQLRAWIREPWRYPRERAIERWGHEFAMDQLPADFAGSRWEGVARGPDFVALGEYEMPAKRVFIVTRTECHLVDHYVHDPKVLHIHALCYDPDTDSLLISTGDASKVLDSWDVHEGKAVFRERLRDRFAGHTGLLKVGAEVYLGTDFSSRPNYIETLTGSRYYFPRAAFRSYVVRFLAIGRYLLSMNKEIEPLGGKLVISIFDTETRRFVFCRTVNELEAEAAEVDDHPAAAGIESDPRDEHPVSAR